MRKGTAVCFNVYFTIELISSQSTNCFTSHFLERATEGDSNNQCQV